MTATSESSKFGARGEQNGAVLSVLLLVIAIVPQVLGLASLGRDAIEWTNYLKRFVDIYVSARDVIAAPLIEWFHERNIHLTRGDLDNFVVISSMMFGYRVLLEIPSLRYMANRLLGISGSSAWRNSTAMGERGWRLVFALPLLIMAGALLIGTIVGLTVRLTLDLPPNPLGLPKEALPAAKFGILSLPYCLMLYQFVMSRRRLDAYLARKERTERKEDEEEDGEGQTPLVLAIANAAAVVAAALPLMVFASVVFVEWQWSTVGQP